MTSLAIASMRIGLSRVSTCPFGTTRASCTLCGEARGKGLNDEQTENHSSF